MRRLAFIVFLLASPLWGQTYGRLNFQLQTPQGQAVSGAKVNVYTQAACGTATLGVQAQLYQTASGTPISQPVITNGNGENFAYTSPGCVTVVYSSPYTGTITRPDTFVDTGTFCLGNAGCTLAGPLTGTTAAFSGNVQGGTLTDGTASLHAGSLTGAVNGTFTGTVTAGTKTILGVHDSASYATALSTLTSIGGTMEVNGSVTIGASQAIPANVEVRVVEGGGFVLGSGAVLTVQGPFEAGLYQVFSGPGTVSFGNPSFSVGDPTSIAMANPEWWGAKADWSTDSGAALNAALASGRCVHLNTGLYLTSVEIQNSGILNKCIVGNGPLQSQIAVKAGSSPTSIIGLFSSNGTTSARQLLQGFRLYADSSTGYASSSCVDFGNNTSNSLIDRVDLTRCAPLGFSATGATQTWSNHIKDSLINGTSTGGPAGYTGMTACMSFLGNPNNYFLENDQVLSCTTGVLMQNFSALKIAGGGASATTTGYQIQSTVPAFSNATYPGSGGGGGIDISGLYIETVTNGFMLAGGSMNIHGNFINNATNCFTLIAGGIGLTNTSIHGNECYSDTTMLNIPASLYFTYNHVFDNRVDSKTSEYPGVITNYQQYVIAQGATGGVIGGQWLLHNTIEDNKWLPQPGANLITQDLWNWSPPVSGGAVFQRSSTVQFGGAPVTEVKGTWAEFDNTLAAPRTVNKYITIRGYVKHNDANTDNALMRIWDGSVYTEWYITQQPNAAYSTVTGDVNEGWIEYSFPWKVSATATDFKVQIGSITADYLWTTPSIVEGISATNIVQPRINGPLVATAVKNLPPASTANKNWIMPVSDGASATDCTVGGGTTYVQCQSNGTTWAQYLAATSATTLSGTTTSIGGGALTAGTCATGTVTVTGATTAMTATATPVTYPGAAFEWNAYVSSANTVTVSVCTNLAAGGTPTASTYNVRVIK